MSFLALKVARDLLAAVDPPAGRDSEWTRGVQNGIQRSRNSSHQVSTAPAPHNGLSFQSIFSRARWFPPFAIAPAILTNILMITSRLGCLFYVATALLSTTVFGLTSLKDPNEKLEGWENNMIDPSKLEFRLGPVSERRSGSEEYLVVDPRGQDILGGVEFEEAVHIHSISMREDWEGRGTEAEALKHLLKYIVRTRPYVRRVTANPGWNERRTSFYKKAGFDCQGPNLGYMQCNYDIPDTHKEDAG